MLQALTQRQRYLQEFEKRLHIFADNLKYAEEYSSKSKSATVSQFYLRAHCDLRKLTNALPFAVWRECLR